MIPTDYDRCTEIKLLKNGHVEVHCKLGLWSVSAPSIAQADREARHYWIQYYRDGEYNDLLESAPTPEVGLVSTNIPAIVGKDGMTLSPEIPSESATALAGYYDRSTQTGD